MEFSIFVMGQRVVVLRTPVIFRHSSINTIDIDSSHIFNSCFSQLAMHTTWLPVIRPSPLPSSCSSF
ncbi:cytochrome [Moniliophthora roreri]|nr:cytochrome [Moniliophthora roreri]